MTEYLGLTKGTVSQSLKALEARGLIEKVADARDRRSVHLRLSAAAQALVAAINPPEFLLTAVEQMGERAQVLEAAFADLLLQIQRSQDVSGFGLCRTCRFHQQRDGGPFCGLTREPLAPTEAELICREHRPLETA